MLKALYNVPLLPWQTCFIPKSFSASCEVYTMQAAISQALEHHHSDKIVHCPFHQVPILHQGAVREVWLNTFSKGVRSICSPTVIRSVEIIMRKNPTFQQQTYLH